MTNNGLQFILDFDAMEKFGVGVADCAYSRNIRRTRMLFTYLCPKGFVVHFIEPLKSNHKPYCRWIVTYKFSDNRPYLPGAPAKHVMDTLTRMQPYNAYVRAKFRCEGSHDGFPAWKIEYGVRCTCQKDFRRPLTQSVSDVLDQSDLSEAFKTE